MMSILYLQQRDKVMWNNKFTETPLSIISEGTLLIGINFIYYFLW